MIGLKSHLQAKTRAFRGFSGILRPRSGGGLRYGAIAQLGERLHGMQEVDGSIPSSSTTFQKRRRGRVPIV